MRTLIAIAMLILVGCQQTVTQADRRLVSHQMVIMQAVTGSVITEPSLVYVKSPGFEIGGQANCNTWTISVNWYVMASDPEYVAFDIIPHEYAHLLSCHFRGGVGMDPHDEYWQKIVVKLGGDPNNV